MTRPTTKALEVELKEVVDKYNESLNIQNQCRERAIEIQAILKDRADGASEDNIASAK
jgi:hypothetical protein